MSDLAARLHVAYLSPYRLLCNAEGGLVRTGDTADSLMTHDSSHLTASGSRYVVGRFAGLE